MRRTARGAIYLGLIVLGGLLLVQGILWVSDDLSASKCFFVLLVGILLVSISSSFIKEATT